MIYLYNTTTSTIDGIFASYDLIDTYATNNNIPDMSIYVYLTEVEQMSYISKTCYLDNDIIYNNKDFWINTAPKVYENFSNYNISDWRNNAISESIFKNEFKVNLARITNIQDSADEVAYNIKIGAEFISLFREECITSDIGDESGLSIATSLSSVIPLIQTGSFKEAVVVLATLTRNTFLTDELLNKYMYMLLAADVISYTG